MAINSQISIGTGIGLQGKPEMYENIAMEQLRYKRKKEDEAKAKDKEVYDKFAGSLAITGYDPIYNKQIATASAKVLDQLNKAQNEKRLNTLSSNQAFLKDYNDLLVLSGNAKLMSQAIADGLKEAGDVSNQGKATINKDLIDKLNTARTTGDVTPELAAYLGERGMGVDRSKFYSMIPPEPFDWRKDWRSISTPTFREGSIEKDAGDLFITEGGKNFDINANKMQARETVADPNSKVGRTAIQVAGGDVAKAEELLYNDLLSRFSGKYQKSLTEKSGGAGVSDEDIETGMKNPQKINIKTSSVNKEGEATTTETTYDSRGYIGFKKPINTREKISKGMIGDENKLITKEGVSKDVSYGSITFPKVWTRQLPGAGENIVVGSIVTDQQLSNLRKRAASGALKVSDFIQEKPYVNASYVEQEVQEGVDNLGNPIYRKIEKQLAIPFDKAKVTLKQNGINVDKIQEESDEFNKNIDEYYGAKSEAPVWSRKDLLATGNWTNAQIDAAIKKGMKVKD